MKSIFDELNDAARSAIEISYGKKLDPILKWSSKPGFGDLQINIAMSLSKKLGVPPRDIATKIIENLDLSNFSDQDRMPEIAGPGFINIYLSNDKLNKYVHSLAKDEDLGIAKSQNPENIVIDYGGANIAKEMHIGHLRSTIIGDSLKRILTFLGNNIIPQDHLGDWGTQFGMLVEFLSNDGTIPKILPDLGDLNTFYKKAQSKFKEDEEFATKARKRVSLLQGGDTDSLRAWKHINNVTMKHILDIYSKLNVLLSEENSRGESMYNDMLSNVCDQLQEKAIAIISDGALVIYSKGILDRDGNPFGLIIRKTDGGYGYATTDIAALKYNAEIDKADRVVYVIDARQSQHMQMVFDATSRAGWIPNTSVFHAAFGTILGDDQKPFKTRSGDIVKLDDVITESISRAKKLIVSRENDFSEAEITELSKSIGIGALKYGDLSNNRAKNYVFDWDRMISMEGNTAPYLQYANARINSLLAKSGYENSEISDFKVDIATQYEREVVKILSRFTETLNDITQTYEPHKLCTYLFDLAQSFSGFYENCTVLNEKDEAIKNSRLNICLQISRTLTRGLDLLGIDAPDRL